MKSVVYSQALRLNRICSEEKDILMRRYGFPVRLQEKHAKLITYLTAWRNVSPYLQQM